MAAITGVACFVFTNSRDHYEESDSIIGVALVLFMILPLLACLTFIPLCGVLDSLVPKQLPQQHPLFVVRLAIDP